MKFYLQLLFCLFFPISAFSQNKREIRDLTQHDADSLKVLLQTTNNDTLKMVVCRQLAWYSFEHKQDSLSYYNEQRLQLSRKLKQKIWEGEALHFRVFININGGKPTEAFEALKEARKIAENEANEKDMYIEPQRASFTTPHTARLVLLAFLELQNDYIHLQSNNYEAAVTDLFNAIKIAESINDEVLLCVFYSHLREPYTSLGKRDSVLWATEKAIYYGKKANFTSFLGQNYQTIAEVYKSRKDFVTAKKYLLESLKVNIETNRPAQVANTYLCLSNWIFRETHQPDSTIFYLRKSLLAYQNWMGDGPEMYDDIYRGISQAYKEKGNIDSAYFYLDRSTTIVNRKFEKQIEDYKKYKDFYVEEQKKLKEAEKKTIQQQNYGLLAGLGVISLIGLILYRNNRHKQKANAVLENTLQELKATQVQLVEKEKIASLAAVQLKELDAVKTRLYTNITHEFRTPLTVILGMAQQVMDKPKEYLQEGLTMITRNGQNLLNLVNQMLDLNKLESGKLYLHYQQSDVIQFLKYMVESLHSLAENKGVQMHFLADLDSLTIDIDEIRLQQVVSNLLSNAVKFTPKGGNIYVSLSKQGDAFALKIRDTGIGISEDKLPYIFARFYQADDSATRHGEGTGIGLSLTHELVKLMRGTISVRSHLNKGSEFEVTLPITHLSDIKETNGEAVHIGENKAVLLEENPLTLGNQSAENEKPLILIADDNADVRAYIASCLAADYHLLIAKDGRECEEMAFDKMPDMVVSDVMMPFKDGFEICKTLKSDERTSHIPIIMLTAKADIDSKLQGIERGADAYLMKPFYKEELLLRIKKLLELRQQLQQYYLSKIGLNAVYTEGGNHSNDEKPIERNTPYVNSFDNSFVIKVKTIVETHLNDADFDIEKLAHALALSSSQVNRKLTALTGLSTNNFMRSIRLIKAKELLLHSGYTVTAIAYDSGFNDPAYFIRVFKQAFGMTPQAWREKNLE